MGTKIGAILDPQTADKWAVEAAHVKRSFVDLGEVGTAAAIDPKATTWIVLTLDEASADLALGDAPADVVTEIRLIIHRAGTGDRAIAWPASVVWLSGSAPILGTVLAAPDVVELMTHDGGVTWYGHRLGGGSSVAEDLPVFSISDAVLITEDDEDIPIFSISDAEIVTVDPAAALTFTPASLAFGAVDIGATSEITVTVTNSGDADATLSGLSVTDDEFAAELIS